MCRKKLCTWTGLGLAAGLAVLFVGCPAAQVSPSPTAFWHVRDLEDLKAAFEPRLLPHDGAEITGFAFNRELRVRGIQHNEIHMAEVLDGIKHHLIGVVKKRGGEIVGGVKDVKEAGVILRAFEFDYAHGKTKGSVRCEVKHHPRHHHHWDLICQVTQHQLRPQ
jgi:hypothetical protein